jgi:hypothetical protein
VCNSLAFRFQGHVPFLVARGASESTVSLAIAIMSVSMFDLATSYNSEGLFLLIGHCASGRTWVADHIITRAVERQARGGFHFHTFRASAVVDDAVSSHVCMREPRDISAIDRQLVEDAWPFGILGTSSLY